MQSIKSPGSEVLEQKKESYSYKNQTQQDNYKYYIARLNKARDQRAQPYEYFNGLDFENFLLMCRQSRNSFFKPAVNEKETVIGSADVEKKMESIVNEIMAMNWQPEILPFDKNNNKMYGLGDDLADIVRQSNIEEKDEDLMRETLVSLLCYPMTVVEERLESVKIGFKNKRTIKQARKSLLHPGQIFFGDIKLPYWRLNDQPYILKYERMTYFQAESIYSDLDNWKYIQGQSSSTNQYSINNFTYRFSSSVGEDEVEILHYFDYKNDEYMLIINGVMMLDNPVSYKKEFGDYDGYHLTISGVKAFDSDFIYFRPIISSAMILANLKQEQMRLIVRKYRLAVEPVLGVSGVDVSKIFNRNIWEPANMIQGATTDNFQILNPWNKGLDNSDVQLMNIIDKTTEDIMGVSPVFQGTGGDKVTATQIQEQMKQALKNLGFAVAGYTRLIRDLTYKRTKTILNNYLNPIEYKKIQDGVEPIYRRFVIEDTSLPGDLRGKKVVQVMNRDLTEDEIGLAYEQEQEAEKNGEVFRYSFLNKKTVEDIFGYFYVQVNQTEREGSALNKIIFNDQLQQAILIQQITGEKIGREAIEVFGRTWKTDANKWFPQQEQVVPGTQPGMPPQATEGSNLNGMIKANTMSNQAQLAK